MEMFEKDCMNGLESWNGDYPDLVRIRDSMSYDKAVGSFIELTGLSHVLSQVGDPLNYFEETVRQTRLKDERDTVVGARIDFYREKYAHLLSPEFTELIGAEAGDLFEGVSKDFYHINYLHLTRNFKNYFVTGDPVVSHDLPRYDSLSYFYSLFYVLSAPRPQAFSVPFAEHKEGDDPNPGDIEFLKSVMRASKLEPDNSRFCGPGSKVFNEAVVLNIAMLDFYRMERRYSKDAYPIEELHSQDVDKMKEYVNVLLRLILGKKDDFSEVLQEDFISQELTAIARRYGFNGDVDGMPGIDNIVLRLRDLRVRIFEHGNLMTARHPTSGVILPPGMYLQENSQNGRVVDLGSGEFARFPNLVKRAYPNYDAYGVDAAIQGSATVGKGAHLRHCDFDNPEQFDMLKQGVPFPFDLVLASNSIHKLKYPIPFLKKVISEFVKSSTGVFYVVCPAYSKLQVDGGDSSITTGSEYLRTSFVQDTSKYLPWSFEQWMDFIVELEGTGIKIQIESLGIGNNAENDTSKRMYLVLRVID